MARRTRSKKVAERQGEGIRNAEAGRVPGEEFGEEEETNTKPKLVRSSSLGDIGESEDRASSAGGCAGAGAGASHGLLDGVVDKHDGDDAAGVQKSSRVTPPTVPALGIAMAADGGSLMTAPAGYQGGPGELRVDTARRGCASKGEGLDVRDTKTSQPGFLTARSPRRSDAGEVVYDSARGLNLNAKATNTRHLKEIRVSKTFNEPSLDSVGSAKSKGSEEPEKEVGADEHLKPAAAATSTATMSLSGYLAGELVPAPVYHTADSFWGQTERDRVYNALWYVPYQLERLIGFGNAICMHAFLGIFTMLPLRVARSLVVLAFHWAGWRSTSRSRSPGSPVGSPAAGDHHHRLLLRGDQVYDLIIAGIFVVMILFLWHIRAGAIYFWVKELTQEFLKLSVLHTALELGDKICCSFGVDVLEALAASCTTMSTNPSATNVGHVVADAMVALLLMVAHAGALMCQALVYGVAMNSKKNSLLALLIASNFTEIKGTVFKRYDPTKIFTLTCQDIVERFHLYIIMLFVLVEEAVGSGQPLPSPRLVVQCLYVLFAEIVIDVTKVRIISMSGEFLSPSHAITQTHTNSHKLTHTRRSNPAAIRHSTPSWASSTTFDRGYTRSSPRTYARACSGVPAPSPTPSTSSSALSRLPPPPCSSGCL